MTSDKTYKSLVTNLLIGNTNKDDFDLEDEAITLDTKIYVQDINQVKEMPNSGISTSDLNMIKLISQGLDLSSVDSAQQGVQGAGVTAREVVIANENARKLKGIFFLFITSMWLQKTTLRMMNVLTYYSVGKLTAAVGKEKIETFKKFIVENVELADGTQGTRGIIIAKDKKSLPSKTDINNNVKEYKELNNDANYEEIAITSEYLNDWEYKIKIVSEDLYSKEGSFAMSKNENKLKTISVAFPEIFQKNKKKLFEDTLTSLGEDIDEYDLSEDKKKEAIDVSADGTPIETPEPNAPEGAEVDLKSLIAE